MTTHELHMIKFVTKNFKKIDLNVQQCEIFIFMANDKVVLTKVEIEEKLKDLPVEELDFVINANNIIGNLGYPPFQPCINAISRSLYLLQKDNVPRNIVNITLLSNKFLLNAYTLNRAEVISLLYYLQQNIGTVQMDMEAGDMPTWSIRSDIFKKINLS
jgi:hypothetical protein